MSKVLKSVKYSIDEYRSFVNDYKNATDKEEKRGFEALINQIKSDFRSEIGKRDPKVIRKNKLGGDLYNLLNQVHAFELTDKQQQDQNKKKDKLEKEINKLGSVIEEIKSSKIYEDAFEWRFEFPEVLDDEGKFVGFDVVIGNPPYVDVKSLPETEVRYLFDQYKGSNNRVNLFSAFIEREYSIIKHSYFICQIIPTAIAFQSSYHELRTIILNTSQIDSIVRLPNETFGEHVGDVKVDTLILTIKAEIDKEKSTEVIAYSGYDRITEIDSTKADLHFKTLQTEWIKPKDNKLAIFNKPIVQSIINKCIDASISLEECAEFCLGITPYDKYQGHTAHQITSKVFHADHKVNETFKPLLKGNDVGYYYVKWNGESWISYGDWLGAPRKQYFFTEKRILVKQIIDWSSKRIWSALTSSELYNTQNAFTIIPKDGFKHEVLISILNSSLMSFYHKKVFLDEFKMRFQKILIKDCKQFPFKKCDKSVESKLTELVNDIVQKREKDIVADINDQLKQIDQLVYEVYGLTEEEIKIVEKN